MIIKFLLIVFLIGFLLFKVLGLFFRVLVGGSANGKTAQHTYQNQQSQSRKRPEGNINIDYIPKGKSKRDPNQFKGGEYVEYEEID